MYEMEQKFPGHSASITTHSTMEAENEHYDEGASPANRHKRKRKLKNSTFIWRAKKQMKEGRFGSLDPETYEYFLHVGESVREMFSNPVEDRRDFCANVLQEISGKEWDIACHPMSSRILQQLIPNTNWKDFAGLRDSLASRLTWDSLGCPAHLLETIVSDAGRRIKENAPEKDDCIQFVKDRTKLFVNNLEHQIQETNFNHVTRACLSVCSETDVEDLHEIVTLAALYIMSWGHLNDHYTDPLISGFVQTLLLATSKCCPPTSHKLQKRLMKNVFLKYKSSYTKSEGEEKQRGAFFESEPLTRLMEAALTASSEKFYLKLFKEFFQDDIQRLALGTINPTHFTVAHLISACRDKFIFEEIYDKLMEIIESLFELGRPSILVAISEKCIDLATKQGDFIQKLKIWCGCDKSEDRFVPCLIRLRKLDTCNLTEHKITKEGSVIVQNIFKFNKPIKVVASFLSLDVSEIISIAEDPKGSWIFNTFLTSNTVGEKSRTRLISKFRNHFLKLASSKFGSRVFEEIWKAAKFKERQSMIAELDRTLLGALSGRCLAKKVQLELYLTDKKTWISRHSNYKDFAPNVQNAHEIKNESN